MKIDFLLIFFLIVIFGIHLDFTQANIENVAIEKYHNLKGEKLKGLSKIIDIKQISDLATTVLTLTKSGLYDKSFLISVVLFANYETKIVIISAFISNTSTQIFSIYMNYGNSLYDSVGLIDIVAAIFFNIFGIIKIVEGIIQPYYENQDKMREIQKEINKTLSLEESIGMTDSNLEKSFSAKDKGIYWNINICVLHATFITILCIFLSEAGDMTQFSTIYVTTNSSKYLIITSSLIAHSILLFLSALIAAGIKYVLSKKALLIVSGAIFIYFSIICCHLIYIHNYLLLSKSRRAASITGNLLNKNNKLKILKKL
jgi:putative Ca2+/H+ antiporter (TMEM165/GDT1 family)